MVKCQKNDSGQGSERIYNHCNRGHENIMPIRGVAYKLFAIMHQNPSQGYRYASPFENRGHRKTNGKE
jgi:hypothetical protein